MNKEYVRCRYCDKAVVKTTVETVTILKEYEWLHTWETVQFKCPFCGENGKSFIFDTCNDDLFYISLDFHCNVCKQEGQASVAAGASLGSVLNYIRQNLHNHYCSGTPVLGKRPKSSGEVDEIN